MAPQTHGRSEAGDDAGKLVVVVGASGAGKDALIAWARSRLAGAHDILFVRRVITRPVQAGSEAHDTLSEAEFDLAQDEGRFCFSWSANGLRYGLPREMADHLSSGGLAVVNGSRGAFSTMSQVFPQAAAVEVTADRATLRARLLARGRESESEVEARLDRGEDLRVGLEPALRIDNTGALEIAGNAFLAFLTAQMRPAALRASRSAFSGR